MGAPTEFHDQGSGSTEYNAKVDAAADKLASGQKLNSGDVTALAAAGLGAAGVAAGVPGLGPIFAAMVAGEMLVAVGMAKLFHLIGADASAGPGDCVEKGPPSGRDDPRWHRWDNFSSQSYAQLGPVSASANAWEPSRLDFERFAVDALGHAWETNQNCGPPWPFYGYELTRQLAKLWNATHDGPTTHYAGPGSWFGGWTPPFGEFLPPEGLTVNTGLPKQTTIRAGGALSVLAINNPIPRIGGGLGALLRREPILARGAERLPILRRR